MPSPFRPGFCAVSAQALLCGMLLVPTPANAAENGKPGTSGRPDRAELRKMLLEKFDSDGDGQLNQQERAAARKAREERRAAGQQGPGQGKRRRPGAAGGNNGQAGNRADFRKRLLDRFDTDGDGKLNETERKAARSEMRSKRGMRGRPMAGRRGGRAGKPGQSSARQGKPGQGKARTGRAGQRKPRQP